MGESSVMTHQRETEEEELLVERVEIVGSEQTGEPDEESSGNENPNEGDGNESGGGTENAPWHNEPEQ